VTPLTLPEPALAKDPSNEASSRQNQEVQEPSVSQLNQFLCNALGIEVVVHPVHPQTVMESQVSPVAEKAPEPPISRRSTSVLQNPLVDGQVCQSIVNQAILWQRTKRGQDFAHAVRAQQDELTDRMIAWLLSFRPPDLLPDAKAHVFHVLVTSLSGFIGMRTLLFKGCILTEYAIGTHSPVPTQAEGFPWEELQSFLSSRFQRTKVEKETDFAYVFQPHLKTMMAAKRYLVFECPGPSGEIEKLIWIDSVHSEQGKQIVREWQGKCSFILGFDKRNKK
jgi:hypothetical protein